MEYILVHTSSGVYHSGHCALLGTPRSSIRTWPFPQSMIHSSSWLLKLNLLVHTSYWQWEIYCASYVSDMVQLSTSCNAAYHGNPWCCALWDVLTCTPLYWLFKVYRIFPGIGLKIRSQSILIWWSCRYNQDIHICLWIYFPSWLCIVQVLCVHYCDHGIFRGYSSDITINAAPHRGVSADALALPCVIFSGIRCSSDIAVDAVPHRAASADDLASPCVAATFGAEY